MGFHHSLPKACNGSLVRSGWREVAQRQVSKPHSCKLSLLSPTSNPPASLWTLQPVLLEAATASQVPSRGHAHAAGARRAVSKCNSDPVTSLLEASASCLVYNKTQTPHWVSKAPHETDRPRIHISLLVRHPPEPQQPPVPGLENRTRCPLPISLGCKVPAPERPTLATACKGAPPPSPTSPLLNALWHVLYLIFLLSVR